ncbi:MAG TPA: PLP-dependent aminotransferase family protein [Syntrophomonadaceae bacterium]|nr:PLP-dependent aminotransferase family protein [Syntrophomonadaceae bacterium]
MLGIALQRENDMTLARQIYQALKEHMMKGNLRLGEALPSTRELAKLLTVSRNTVCEAYEMLSAEGFIESRQGSSTRVAEGLCLETNEPGIEDLGEVIKPPFPCLVDFRTGKPDLRRFPRQSWMQAQRKAVEVMPLEQWGYTGPDGLDILRSEISAWLFRSRGITVNPKNLFITVGATQALHILAELLSRKGQKIMVEDPCHTGMLRVLQGRGYDIHPLPVDEQGLQTDYLEGDGAYAMYVTPSHQFPLGGILPAGRRTTLVQFARKHDQYIIEDDYDSEFRYTGVPVAPLYSMDPQRVIYVGTFSKILFPALRIGYVILPPHLHAGWRDVRTHIDVQNPPFEQAALAAFLGSRKIDRYVRMMRKVYGQRRRILLGSLEKDLGRTWRSWGDAAGLHLAVQFSGMCFDHDFSVYARQHGVCVTPVEYHSIKKGLHLDKILLGYGHLEEAEISSGVSLLKNLLEQI